MDVPVDRQIAGIYRDNQGNSGGSNGGGGQSEDALARLIAGADSGQIKAWAGRIADVQQQTRIPTGSPLKYIGSHAAPATFEMGGQFDVGYRKLFANAPWRSGVDGGNLPQSGKPLVVEGAPFHTREAFQAASSDIPEDWVSQMGGEMHNARVNEKPYNRQLLAMGRYSMIRV